MKLRQENHKANDEAEPETQENPLASRKRKSDTTGRIQSVNQSKRKKAVPIFRQDDDLSQALGTENASKLQIGSISSSWSY